jgi:hypothetical protein
MPDAISCVGQRQGVIAFLGNSDGFFGIRHPLSEISQLGQAPDQPAACGGRGDERQAEALTSKLPLERFHVLREEGDRPSIFAQNVVFATELEARFDLKGDISESLADAERTPTAREDLVKVPLCAEVAGHIGSDPPQPSLITQGLGETFGGAKMLEKPLLFSEHEERVAQLAPKIDRLLAPHTTVGKVLERDQGLLEERHCLAVD